jgi:L-threonylcarbamoyladenylate synthase
MSRAGLVTAATDALRAGELVILPTDTVYGLACTADREEPARRLYRLKGRSSIQPTSLLVDSVDTILRCLPEAGERALRVAHALLPGPFTLVLPNPTRRFAWLAGDRPDTIGVRVPRLTATAGDVVNAVCAVAATSANLPGGRDPCRVADIPQALLDGVAVVLDGGELPGTPSTVVDLTGTEPTVLREGAVSTAEVLRLLEKAG